MLVAVIGVDSNKHIRSGRGEYDRVNGGYRFQKRNKLEKKFWILHNCMSLL